MTTANVGSLTRRLAHHRAEVLGRANPTCDVDQDEPTEWTIHLHTHENTLTAEQVAIVVTAVMPYAHDVTESGDYAEMCLRHDVAARSLSRRAVTWPVPRSPVRWTRDSSPSSTVFPTDNRRPTPDSWRHGCGPRSDGLTAIFAAATRCCYLGRWKRVMACMCEDWRS
jgi:hypothetical protein